MLKVLFLSCIFWCQISFSNGDQTTSVLIQLSSLASRTYNMTVQTPYIYVTAGDSQSILSNIIIQSGNISKSAYEISQMTLLKKNGLKDPFQGEGNEANIISIRNNNNASDNAKLKGFLYITGLDSLVYDVGYTQDVRLLVGITYIFFNPYYNGTDMPPKYRGVFQPTKYNQNTEIILTSGVPDANPRENYFFSNHGETRMGFLPMNLPLSVYYATVTNNTTAQLSPGIVPWDAVVNEAVQGLFLNDDFPHYSSGSTGVSQIKFNPEMNVTASFSIALNITNFVEIDCGLEQNLTPYNITTSFSGTEITGSIQKTPADTLRILSNGGRYSIQFFTWYPEGTTPPSPTGSTQNPQPTTSATSTSTFWLSTLIVVLTSTALRIFV